MKKAVLFFLFILMLSVEGFAADENIQPETGYKAYRTNLECRTTQQKACNDLFALHSGEVISQPANRYVRVTGPATVPLDKNCVIRGIRYNQDGSIHQYVNAISHRLLACGYPDDDADGPCEAGRTVTGTIMEWQHDRSLICIGGCVGSVIERLGTINGQQTVTARLTGQSCSGAQDESPEGWDPGESGGGGGDDGDDGDGDDGGDGGGGGGIGDGDGGDGGEDDDEEEEEEEEDDGDDGDDGETVTLTPGGTDSGTGTATGQSGTGTATGEDPSEFCKQNPTHHLCSKKEANGVCNLSTGLMQNFSCKGDAVECASLHSQLQYECMERSRQKKYDDLAGDFSRYDFETKKDEVFKEIDLSESLTVTLQGESFLDSCSEIDDMTFSFVQDHTISFKPFVDLAGTLKPVLNAIGIFLAGVFAVRIGFS